jgi:cytochrome P450
MPILRSDVAMQCLLDNLLMTEDDSGRGMSREALRDELMTLLVAGQETSAILLAWTCAYLAHHPAVQARAAEELLQVPPVLMHNLRDYSCITLCD